MYFLETNCISFMSGTSLLNQYNWTADAQKVLGEILALLDSDWFRHIFYFPFMSPGRSDKLTTTS